MAMTGPLCHRVQSLPTFGWSDNRYTSRQRERRRARPACRCSSAAVRGSSRRRADVAGNHTPELPDRPADRSYRRELASCTAQQHRCYRAARTPRYFLGQRDGLAAVHGEGSHSHPRKRFRRFHRRPCLIRCPSSLRINLIPRPAVSSVARQYRETRFLLRLHFARDARRPCSSARVRPVSRRRRRARALQVKLNWVVFLRHEFFFTRSTHGRFTDGCHPLKNHEGKHRELPASAIARCRPAKRAAHRVPLAS